MENKEILAFFGTLPDVPLSSIVQYLKVPKLIMISLQFPQWRKFCCNQIQKINQENGKDFLWSLCIHNNVLKISDEKYSGRINFSISLKVKEIEEEFSFYREEEKNLKLLIDCKNQKIMEEIYINIFKLIHSSSLEKVTVNVNKNGRIENLNLLERILTGQTVKMMFMSGGENNTVDGNDLNSVIEASKEIGSLTTSRTLPSVEFNYGNNLHELVVSNGMNPGDESDILTTEYIKKINCRSYTVWWKIFAPEHLNTFLHSWISGGNENVRKMVLVFSKTASREEVQKIFEGLDAKEWNPERREARFIVDEPERPYYLNFHDLSGGKDIIRPDGTVGTLMIYRREWVVFYVWTDRFPWENKRESYEQRLMECEEFLAQADKNLVAETEKEMSKVDSMWKKSCVYIDSEYYKESSKMRKKIINELIIQDRITSCFKYYADYLSTFNE